MIVCCSRVLDRQVVSQITYTLSPLVRATAVDVHAPVMEPEQQRTHHTHTAIAFSGEVFPYALIIIALVILVLGIAGIIYIWVSWSR